MTREIKKFKNYAYLEVNSGTSDTSDFQVLHSTPHLTPLSAVSLCSLDPYVVMLYWSQKISKSKNQ